VTEVQALRAIARIIDDIMERNVMDEAWSTISAEVHDEIREAWVDILMSSADE
jgi:hypothetical protein